MSIAITHDVTIGILLKERLINALNEVHREEKNHPRSYIRRSPQGLTSEAVFRVRTSSSRTQLARLQTLETSTARCPLFEASSRVHSFKEFFKSSERCPLRLSLPFRRPPISLTSWDVQFTWTYENTHLFAGGHIGERLLLYWDWLHTRTWCGWCSFEILLNRTIFNLTGMGMGMGMEKIRCYPHLLRWRNFHHHALLLPESLALPCQEIRRMQFLLRPLILI